jgi:excisionase family DNA binding protein
MAEEKVKREGLATVAEVAEFLHVSRSMIYRLMDRGDLPYHKIRTSRRVRWADVDKLVSATLVQS